MPIGAPGCEPMGSFDCGETAVTFVIGAGVADD